MTISFADFAHKLLLLNISHSSIIYNKILIIPIKHFHNFVHKQHTYKSICNALQKDNFC